MFSWSWALFTINQKEKSTFPPHKFKPIQMTKRGNILSSQPPISSHPYQVAAHITLKSNYCCVSCSPTIWKHLLKPCKPYLCPLEDTLSRSFKTQMGEVPPLYCGTKISIKFGIHSAHITFAVLQVRILLSFIQRNKQTCKIYDAIQQYWGANVRCLFCVFFRSRSVSAAWRWWMQYVVEPSWL